MFSAGRYQHTSNGIKLLQWLGLMGLLTIILCVVFVYFPDHTSTSALKWLQFSQTLAVFLLPAFIVAYLWSERPLEWLHLSCSKNTRTADAVASRWMKFGFPVLLMVVAMPGINLLGYWNMQLQLPEWLSPFEQWLQQQEEAAAVLTERFLRVRGARALIINIGLMALLPAVAEEITFRGVLLNLCSQDETLSMSKRQHVAIWLVAIIFSAIHMQFYGFVPRMLLGALFGYMLVWTGTLWVPILMHFVNNAIAVVGYYIVYQKNIDPSTLDAIGSGDTLWLGVLSVVLTVLGCYIFRRSRTISSASSRMS